MCTGAGKDAQFSDLALGLSERSPLFASCPPDALTPKDAHEPTPLNGHAHINLRTHWI